MTKLGEILDESLVATDCDECSDPILYGATCYARPTGEVLDGKPVVRIFCSTCHASTPLAISTRSASTL